mmetsp:Transcript_1405/g.2836  ORF Transcript_1405/g.2836 Transcript_1405/m.2836 type:complete len:581 (+) Transcript_1405:148-1890(+)
MNQQRRQPRPAGEPRAVGGRPEGPDVNRDRLIFCITSLVGHRVTASLRNNVMYEGIFHSCSLESDYSITLKSARRLPSDGNAKGGDTVPTMIIPGKDFLQVSAMNVAPLAEDGPRKGFATDAEISRKEAESSRDLVPWAGGEHGAGGGLEDGPNDSKWDQFSVNEKMYGISSTYNEDLYTTKLDKNAIPLAKREQADRIAREIESGASYAEVEERIDGEDDEEARFSAVGAPGQGAKETKALSRNPLPQVPERPGQQDLDRGNSRKGMISEMKRINALNLEPTSAKHEDTSSRSRLTMKQQQERSANRLAAQTAQGTNNTADLKSEFQQSLDLISRQEASRAKRQQGEGGWEGNQQGQMAKAGGYPKSGDQSRTPNSSFSFNKSAKPFSLNPQAGEFTPSGGQASGPPPAKAGGNAPNFSVYKKDPNMKSKSLTDILEPFLQRAKGSSPDSSAPDWPDARGPSYHDVLGQPNAGARPMMGPQGGGPIGHMPQMGGWQPQQQPMMQPGQPGQQQQVQQQPGPQQVPPQHGQDQGGPPVMGGGGNAGMMPQMMQSGFVVANAPGGGGGGAGGGGGGGDDDED